MAKNTVLTQYNSPNYTPNGQVAATFGYPRSIDYITIHWWGDPNQQPTFEGVVSWLCNSRSGVSCHDVITGTGYRVAVIVDYPNAGWHAGNALGNATSLGFECDPRARQEDYEAVAEDIADTWKYYGRIIPLRGHKTWTSTACPGNYDLNRLHQMALAIYNGQTKTTATADEVRQAYRDILEREADAAGIATYTTNGMSIAEVRSSLLNSEEKKALEAAKAATYAKNEWVRNLTPYTAGDLLYEKGVELQVSPAEGAKRYNLENGALFNNEVIPRGTNVTVVAKTRAFGQDYLISAYSKKSGQPIGIPANLLVVPAVPPVVEKPEWLKNLSDIADQDFWTRSATPVLNLENGAVVDTYPINKQVRITHATEIVGKPLLVLEGGKLAIETLYLSDKQITNPTDDIEKRLTALEAFAKMVGDFLAALFVNFKK
jgi:hypothetical protein